MNPVSALVNAFATEGFRPGGCMRSVVLYKSGTTAALREWRWSRRVTRLKTPFRFSSVATVAPC